MEKIVSDKVITTYDVDTNEMSICFDCKYLMLDNNKFPCVKCMVVFDGYYFEAINFTPLKVGDNNA